LAARARCANDENGKEPAVPRSISRLFGFALLLAIVATPMLVRGTVAQDAATPAATPCPPLTEEAATAFATAYFAAWNAHDTAAIVALHTPDTMRHWGIGIDTEGSEALGASLDAFFAAFPGIHGTVDRVWVAGDTVIVRYIAIGVQETDYMGVPASKDTVTWTGINVMQLDCGLVAETWAEADHFGRIEQQGVIGVASPEAEATPAA
jgi:steroid delta-isomerase-like uncharacterized protein